MSDSPKKNDLKAKNGWCPLCDAELVLNDADIHNEGKIECPVCKEDFTLKEFLQKISYVKCPQCGKDIKRNAEKCRFCGKDIRERKVIQKFKEFMLLRHGDYVLVTETESTLSYKKEIAASSANCGTAGCLFLLGILPGIIYYFISKSDAKVLTLNVMYKDGIYTVSGDNCQSFSNEFSRF